MALEHGHLTAFPPFPPYELQPRNYIFLTNSHTILIFSSLRRTSVSRRLAKEQQICHVSSPRSATSDTAHSLRNILLVWKRECTWLVQTPQTAKMSLDWLQRKPDSAGRQVPPTWKFSPTPFLPSYSLSLFEAYLVTASLASIISSSLSFSTYPLLSLDFYCTIIASHCSVTYIART